MNEATLDQIASKQAITEKLYQYCRAVDRLDQALGYGVWHEDGLADYGPMFQGTGRGFIDWVFDQHLKLVCSSRSVFSGRS